MERLLGEASSRELTAWQQFFVVDAERTEDTRRRAREDARLMGEDV